MNKKRMAYGVMGGAMAFAAVFGAAASLGTITSDKVGADDTTVASCDTNGVTTDYTTAYNTTTTAGYKVDTVVVSGIADACDGQTMKITLTGASNATLAEATATVDVNSTANPADTGDSISILSQNALAESVQGIHIVISG